MTNTKAQTLKNPANEEPDVSLASVIEFGIDLNDQEEPVPLPEGEYEAEIRGAEIKDSQRGTKYGEVTFFISPDQYPATYDEGNPDGETLKYRKVSLEDNPRARYNTRLFIEAIGAPLGKRIDLNQWIGQRARVTVTHEEYEGVTRATVNRVNPL